MTPKTIKEGMRFKLGVWTWRVIQINYMEEEFTAYDKDNKSVLELDIGEAHHLDWLEPEVKKLTKEQAEMIKEKVNEINGLYSQQAFDIKFWLDSITEKT